MNHRDRSAPVTGCIALALLATASPVGASGLVARHVERPIAQMGQPNSISFFARVVQCTKPGKVGFEYFVDSEPNADRLIVTVDGTETFSRSGAQQAGNAQVPLALGNHTIRFSYAKNSSIDEGSDSAWVDKVRIACGAQFESYNFEDQGFATPQGWTGGGSHGGLSQLTM